jgi:hypothetical protein
VCFVFSSVVFCLNFGLNFSYFFYSSLVPWQGVFPLFIYLDFYKHAGLRVSLV